MKYIFIFIAPVINLALFELFFFQRKISFFLLSLILVDIVIFFSIKKIANKKLFSINLYRLACLPILFSSSIIIYSSFIPINFFVQLLYIINFLFTYYYFKNTYFNEKEPDSKKVFFENASSYGNFLIMFFCGASAYALKSFLNTPVWILIFALAVIIPLLIQESLWINKIEDKNGKIYIFLICLILIQISWAICFLPLNYNVLGLILTICYYIIIGLTKFFLKKNLDKKTIKLYLIFGLASMLLILLTAKWVQ